MARKIDQAHRLPFAIGAQRVQTSTSIGIAYFRDVHERPEDLIRDADAAMYRAKEAGRGGFQFYDRSMNAKARERLQMETLLRHAIDRNEFVLHYQPRIDLDSGRIVGAEALFFL